MGIFGRVGLQLIGKSVNKFIIHKKNPCSSGVPVSQSSTATQKKRSISGVATPLTYIQKFIISIQESICRSKLNSFFIAET